MSTLLRLGNKNVDFDDLLEFFNDRFRVHLSEKGLPHDVLNSIISKNYENVPLKDIFLRALAITAFVTTVAGKDLIQGYKRAANILSAEEKKDGVEYSLDPNLSLMRETTEKNLFQKLLEIEKLMPQVLNMRNLNLLYLELEKLKKLLIWVYKLILITQSLEEIDYVS